MAKKYHSGMKGKHVSIKEVRGREVYASEDTRRELESKDFAMISEDHNAMANLPQQVMMKYYPKSPYGMDFELDDTIRGVDKQMSADDNGMKKHISKSKY